MKKTIAILWILLVSVGIFFPNLYGSILDTVKFGSISYPTSLDSLENPTPTQSVATAKSHSQQHSDANDGIEALQAKLGISASTAVANSFLVGNGSGSSIWSTFPTTTNLTATGAISASGLGTFGSFISNASSTIVGGLTITGNSTTTNATSTNGAFTGSATSTKYYGAGLSNCSGGNYLIWASGLFGCESSLAGTNAKNSIPEPILPNVGVSNLGSIPGTVNTILSLGMVNVPKDIIVSRIKFGIGGVITPGQYKIGFYSEDGQTLVFSTTTQTISTTGVKTADLTASTTVVAGNYWIGVIGVGSLDVEASAWGNDFDGFIAQDTLKLTGTTTATASTLPSTFSPSNVTNWNDTNHTLYLKLEN